MATGRRAETKGIQGIRRVGTSVEEVKRGGRIRRGRKEEQREGVGANG